MSQIDNKNVTPSTPEKVVDNIVSQATKGNLNKDLSARQWSRLQGYAW
jgi:hypothetical protein